MKILLFNLLKKLSINFKNKYFDKIIIIKIIFFIAYKILKQKEY